MQGGVVMVGQGEEEDLVSGCCRVVGVGLGNVVEVSVDWCVVFCDISFVWVCRAKEACGCACSDGYKWWWETCR